MTIIEILNTYKKQKCNTYRECDVINAMNKYGEYREARSIQLMQTAVVWQSEQFTPAEIVHQLNQEETIDDAKMYYQQKIKV